MTIQQISQSADTIIEATYEYERVLKDNPQSIDKIKKYILALGTNIKNLIEEEKKNV